MVVDAKLLERETGRAIDNGKSPIEIVIEPATIVPHFEVVGKVRPRAVQAPT